MPRPKKPDSEKTTPLHARFKKHEIVLIEAAAEAEVLPVAAYIHKATMEYTRENFDIEVSE